MGFQQELLEDRPTAVYRLYNTAGRLLYVGLTCNEQQRWNGHGSTKLWWHEVQRKELTWYPCRSEAEAEERRAIAEELPKYNVIGAVESEGHGLQIDHHKGGSASLRIPPELAAEARKHLANTGWTMTDLVVAIVAEYVKRPRTREKQLEPFKPPRKRGRPPKTTG